MTGNKRPALLYIPQNRKRSNWLLKNVRQAIHK